MVPWRRGLRDRPHRCAPAAACGAPARARSPAGSISPLAMMPRASRWPSPWTTRGIGGCVLLRQEQPAAAPAAGAATPPSAHEACRLPTWVCTGVGYRHHYNHRQVEKSKRARGRQN